MTNPADRDPVLMAVVEALWDEMGMIADDATCMGMLYAALLSERQRGREEMRDRAAKAATDRFDVPPEEESEPPAFYVGWESCARRIATAIRSLSTED